jgi:hypothetical protein
MSAFRLPSYIAVIMYTVNPFVSAYVQYSLNKNIQYTTRQYFIVIQASVTRSRYIHDDLLDSPLPVFTGLLSASPPVQLKQREGGVGRLI